MTEPDMTEDWFGIRSAGKARRERERNDALNRIAECKEVEAERDHLRSQLSTLQTAIDKAYAALHGSQYVGSPSEREAYRTALDALGAVVTQKQGAGKERDGGSHG